MRQKFGLLVIRIWLVLLLLDFSFSADTTAVEGDARVLQNCAKGDPDCRHQDEPIQKNATTSRPSTSPSVAPTPIPPSLSPVNPTTFPTPAPTPSPSEMATAAPSISPTRADDTMANSTDSTPTNTTSDVDSNTTEATSEMTDDSALAPRSAPTAENDNVDDGIPAYAYALIGVAGLGTALVAGYIFWARKRRPHKEAVTDKMVELQSIQESNAESGYGLGALAGATGQENYTRSSTWDI